MEDRGDCSHSPVRALRTDQGVSLEALARHCALSHRQLRQIEEGGHDAFYSLAIKQLAERKVLSVLQDAQAVQVMQRAGSGTVRTLVRPAPPRHSVLPPVRTQRVA